MTRELDNGHLSPEVFVDVLEGSPVDASWQQHLSTCLQCRQELFELEQTLSLVTADAGIGQGEEPERSRRGVPAWVIAAAAAFVASVGLYWFVAERDPSPPASTELEELLPPVDEDEEFQLLLALSDSAADDDELVDIEAPAFDGFALDPDAMTPGERQRFVERLTEEMRSSL